MINQYSFMHMNTTNENLSHIFSRKKTFRNLLINFLPILLFILHVIWVMLQLFNILLKKVLIWKQKIINKKLLFIKHVEMVIFKLFNTLLNKVLIEAKDKSEQETLLLTCWNCHLPIVQYPIEKWAKIEVKDKYLFLYVKKVTLLLFNASLEKALILKQKIKVMQFLLI